MSETIEKTPQEEVEYLNSIEEENLQKAIEAWEEYIKKEYEILEDEVREVDPEEWIKVRENPLDFPPSVQRKYFWVSAEDYKFPTSIDPNEEWFEVPEGKYVHSYIATNPYTKEEKEIFELRDIPTPAFEEIVNLLLTSEDPSTVKTYGYKGFDIDSCILQRFFGGDRGKEIGFTQRMIYLQMKERTPEEEEEMKIIFAGYEKKEEFKNFLKSLNQ